MDRAQILDMLLNVRFDDDQTVSPSGDHVQSGNDGEELLACLWLDTVERTPWLVPEWLSVVAQRELLQAADELAFIVAVGGLGAEKLDD